MKELIKNNNYLNKNRVIILSILSIILVITLLLGSTYSLFSATNIDEDLHVYKTGNLNITYTLSEDNIIFDKPTTYSIKESANVVPYRITINNIGNVAYKFNLILANDTAVNSIDFKYIMTKVGKLDPISLSDCTDNIIKKDIVIGPNESVVVDVRVWISDTLQNSEIGKSFYAKLKIDGIAVQNEYKKEDNSILRADYPLLNEMPAGSYVKYIGNNGCGNTNCDGTNANVSATYPGGYCYSTNYQYTTSGWRIGYKSSGEIYLISGGAPECICTNSDGTTSNSSCSTYETTTVYHYI